MKAFLPLALPAEHPFWTAEERPLPSDLPEALVQPEPGAVLMRSGGDVTLLSGQQHNRWARGGSAKYAKFAYSTRFGFSLPVGELGLEQGAYDSMLAVSDDAGEGEPVHWRVREEPVDTATGEDGTIVSTWRPWPDVEITTWLTAAAPWHLRTHRVRTGRTLHTAEGGFAVDRDGGPTVREETMRQRARGVPGGRSQRTARPRRRPRGPGDRPPAGHPRLLPANRAAVARGHSRPGHPLAALGGAGRVPRAGGRLGGRAAGAALLRG